MNHIPDMVSALAQKLGIALPEWLILAIGILVAAGVMLGVVSVVAIFWIWVERRLSGLIQSRRGPNRVGPFGLLQSFADGLKLFAKEDIIPDNADRFFFKFAPVLVFVGAFVPFAAVPFSENIVATHINLGIYYVLSFMALEVMGVIMAGWASNSKWTMYGGMRLAAQMMSYEIPMGLSVLSIVVLVGSLNLGDIVAAQAGPLYGIVEWLPFNWFVFNPFGFLACIIFFVAGLASAKRLPFDLPEAESELVSGFHTEYSGMRFSMFFLAEYGAMWVICMLTAILFLGGWHGPRFFVAEGGVAYQLLGALYITLKASVLMASMVWIRWTFPRIRIDQVMYMCLKVMLPLGMICLLAMTVWALTIGSPADVNEAGQAIERVVQP